MFTLACEACRRTFDTFLQLLRERASARARINIIVGSSIKLSMAGRRREEGKNCQRVSRRAAAGIDSAAHRPSQRISGTVMRHYVSRGD